MTIRIEHELSERLRNAAYAKRISINKLAEAYLGIVLETEEDKYGGKFPQRNFIRPIGYKN